MSANIGMLDRLVQVVIGLVLIAHALPVWFAPAAWNRAGLMPLVTAVLGFCPIYSLFGFSTCPLKSAA